MKVTRTKVGVDPFVEVGELKSYLQFNGSSKDAELTQAIEAATQSIEDRKNLSLRNMELQQIGQSDERGFIQLYYPKITSVDRVIDINGTQQDYALIAAIDAIKVRANVTYIINYKTEACDNASVYKQAVIAKAASIFEGNE